MCVGQLSVRPSVRRSLDGQLGAANLFTDDAPILLLARALVGGNCYQARLDRAGRRSVQAPALAMPTGGRRDLIDATANPI